MTVADSSSRIPEADRDLMRRLSIVLLFVFGLVAAVTQLDLLYSEKFFDDTGKAKWIWAQHRITANEPVAFFATREFDLPERRAWAHLKILGDPEYTLWLNGTEIGGRLVGEERVLDLYDVSTLVKPGRNRIVVAVRARQGVGGLIAAIDFGPEQENVVVTDERWRMYTRWSLDLLTHDPPDLPWQAPMIFGAPPYGRWNYLARRTARISAPVQKVVQPQSSSEVKAMLPTIRTRSGVAVAVADPMRATVYDFGIIRGRVRLTVERATNVAGVLNVRFANSREELERVEWNVRTYVIAAGERLVVDPDVRDFRYVMVYGRRARVEVLQ